MRPAERLHDGLTARVGPTERDRRGDGDPGGAEARSASTSTIQQYPSGKYFSDYAGAPAFVHRNDVGLMMMAWGADWPTGYGFLDQIVDGAPSRPPVTPTCRS